MTRDETTLILAILKTSYPNYYKDLTSEEVLNVIDLWTEMFSEDDVNLVKIAVKEVIKTSVYPPAIAAIKNKIYDIQNLDDKEPIELWNKLKGAISNSIYHSQEMFEGLPEECKIFIGSPARLKEYAMGDAEVNNTVVKGQFLKQIESIKKRKKDDKMMLPETRLYRERLATIGQDISNILSDSEREEIRLKLEERNYRDDDYEDLDDDLGEDLKHDFDNEEY